MRGNPRVIDPKKVSDLLTPHSNHWAKGCANITTILGTDPSSSQRGIIFAKISEEFFSTGDILLFISVYFRDLQWLGWLVRASTQVMTDVWTFGPSKTWI